MALSSFVYIRDVENLSDARFAAGMGVDLLGFRLDPKDESSLVPEQFKEISDWISGVQFVGEFGNANPEQVRSLIQQLKVDFILVSDILQLQDFSTLGLPLIYRADMADGNEFPFNLNYYAGIIDYLLLESGQDVLNDSDLKLISALTQDFSVLLGYGVTVGNAKTIAEELNLKGISLKGSTELRPGYKDFDEFADILEALEID